MKINVSIDRYGLACEVTLARDVYYKGNEWFKRVDAYKNTQLLSRSIEISLSSMLSLMASATDLVNGSPLSQALKDATSRQIEWMAYVLSAP